MKDFEQIEQLWKAQPEKRIRSADDVLRQVKRDMGSLSRKLFLGVLAMFITVALMFLIVFFVPFKSTITYLGIGIIMLTVCIYAVMMMRDYKLISRNDFTTDPKSYLNQLKKYQQNRAMLAGLTYYIYTLLLSAGFGLSFIEILNPLTLWLRIAAYTITAGWFLFCTFYLKDRINKAEEEKVALIIDRLERLQGQW